MGDWAIFAGGIKGTSAGSAQGLPEFVASNVVDIYTRSSGTWSTSRLPKPMLLGVATSVGRRAFFASKVAGDTFILDTATGRWSSPTVPLAGASELRNLNGRALLIGKDNKNERRAFLFNVTTGRWQPITVPRITELNGVLVGTKLVQDSSAGLTIFDTVTHQTSVVLRPAELQDAHFPGISALGSKVFYNVASAPQEYFEIYDLGTATWSVANKATHESAAGANVGSQLVFAGGTSGIMDLFGPVYDTVDVYNDTSPVATLAGTITGSANGRASVMLRNTGDAPLAQGYTVNVYASPNRTLNGAILIGHTHITTPLAAGAQLSFTIRTAIPGDMPVGTYRLLAAVDSTRLRTPVAAEDQTFRVRRPQTFGRFVLDVLGRT